MNMLPLATAPAAIQALASGLAWKSTVLLAAVLIIVRAMTRRRATVAAAVANAGLAGILLLPALTLSLSPLEVACLPARADSLATGPISLTTPPPVEVAPDRTPGLEAPPAAPPSLDFESDEGKPLPKIGDDRPLPEPPSRQVAARIGAVASPARPWIGQQAGWAAVVVAAYRVVVALLLVRLAGGFVVVARLRREAVVVDAPVWGTALERWRVRLGISYRVGLAWSTGVSVPVVVGWRRPIVLLPASAAAVDPAVHADAVLLHELAHVRRGDYAWNVLQRLTVAMYWIHPLAWLLARSASEARERACDDLCVHELGGPAGYRDTLLAMASSLVRRPGPSLGMAMARRPRLARRLAAIAHSRGSSRCQPRRPARLAIVVLGLAAAGLIGAVRLTRAEARQAADEAQAAKSEPEGQPGGGAGKVFHLQVVAADSGKPVPSANVRVWIALHDDWRTTDAHGRLDVRHSTGPADRSFTVDVWGDGFAMQRHHWGSRPAQPVPDEATIRLLPGETLGGLVQDDQGRPIGGATVYLWSHNYKKRDPHELLYDLRATTGPDGRWQASGAPETTGELLGFHVDHPDYLSDRDYTTGREKPTIADLRAGKAISVMTKGVPIEGRVIDADGRPVAGATVYSSRRQGNLGSGVHEFAVTTDEAGHFRTGQVRPEVWYLVAMARGHAPGEQQVKVGTAVPQVEIRLGRPRPFEGRVVDPDEKPIEGAFVNVDSWRRNRFLGVFLHTDRDGRFRWDDAPDDPLEINVDHPGYVGLSRQRVGPSAKDVTFTLKPSLLVHGKVLDAETRKPVESATLEYAPIDPKTGEVASWTAMPRVGRGIRVYRGDLRVNIPVAADAYKIRILAEGYEPFVSRVFRRDAIAVYDYDVNLTPARPGEVPVATVLRADGKPLIGARVYRGGREEGNLSLHNGAVQTGRNSGREVRTAPDGTFPIPPLVKPWVVLIVGDDCYAFASQETLRASPRVQARPYARVRGRYLIGGRPGANLPILLRGIIQDRSTMLNTILVHHEATTDDEGRFQFDKVIPTNDLHVGRHDPGDGPGRIWSLGVPVRVEPGATATVTIGGRGRPVVGRVELPEGWTAPVDFTEDSSAGIESNRPWTPYPLELFRGKTSLQDGESSRWLQQWRESAEGRDYRDRRVAESIGLSPDGSFRLDDVPAGEYRLSLRVNEQAPFGETGPFARLVQVFTVPPVPGGRSDEPLDLGPLRLRPRVTLKPGDPAPGFEVTTVDGKRLAVPGDFQGKVLLLDFGTLWDQQSAIQITRLNDVYQKFGKDPRFVILSLTLAADDAETRKYVADKGEPWPQAIVGPFPNPIATAYGVHDWNVWGAILIGPDGKLAAPRLFSAEIARTVGEVLGRK
jgi:beta-lactamase regulating signal transducer with metallopeptidase domain/protocatechuate 3,4-dioxygenase beta subunit